MLMLCAPEPHTTSVKQRALNTRQIYLSGYSSGTTISEFLRRGIADLVHLARFFKSCVVFAAKKTPESRRNEINQDFYF
jgi:hypothetical protein